MKTRIIAGAVFALVVAVTFFLAPAAVTAVTMAFMTALASYELLHTTGLVKSLRLNVYSAVMAVLVVLWSYFGCGYASMLLGVLCYLMLLFGELLLSSGKTPAAQVGLLYRQGKSHRRTPRIRGAGKGIPQITPHSRKKSR